MPTRITSLISQTIIASEPEVPVTLAEAIGDQFLHMEAPELETFEGNIGQLVLAQAVLFLKTQFRIRECIPESQAHKDLCALIVKLPALGASAKRSPSKTRRL
jgi:hypothetical protein